MFYSPRKMRPYSKLFWSAFSRIWPEYGKILGISPYSVRMRKNTDQNNSEYRHVLRSDYTISKLGIFVLSPSMMKEAIINESKNRLTFHGILFSSNLGQNILEFCIILEKISFTTRYFISSIKSN